MIIVTTVSHYSRYNHYYETGVWEWIFLGKSGSNDKHLDLKLAKNPFNNAHSVLQDLSIKARSEYIELIDELSSHNDSWMWWASRSAYKSPLSECNYESIYFYLIAEYIIRECTKKSVIVILKDPFIVNDLKRNFRMHENVIFEDARIEMGTYLFTYNTNMIFKNIIFLMKIFTEVVLSLSLKIKYKNYIQNLDSLLKSANTLLITWIHGERFDKSNNYSDKYLFRISETIHSNTGSSLLLSHPFIGRKLCSLAIKSNDIVPSTLYAKLTDVLKVAILLLKYRYRYKSVSSYYRYSSILKYSHVRNGYSMSAIYFSILTENIIKNNRHIKSIVYPFENQPYEKAIIYRLKNYNIRTIAIQHASIPFNYFNYFYSPFALDLVPQPTIIGLSSNHYMKVIRKSNYTSHLVNIGSVRDGLYNDPSQLISGKPKTHTNYTILILLSYSVIHNYDLISYLLEPYNAHYHYVVKPHPDHDVHQIKQHFGSIPGYIKFVDGNISELYSKYEYALHNGTTAIIGAISHGLKVGKYLSKSLDIDPLLNSGLKQNIVNQGNKIDLRLWKKTVLDISLFEKYNEPAVTELFL